MATVVNDRDVLIMGAASRYTQLAPTIGLAKPLEDSAWIGAAVATVADGKAGSIVRRSKAGVYENLHAGMFTPLDRTRTYRTRFWARAAAGTTGFLYHTLRQFTAANEASTGPANGGRDPYKPVGIAAHTQWVEYTQLWTTADWQAGVTHIRPDFLLNYRDAGSGSPVGYWEIQGFVFEDVTEAVAARAAADTAKTEADKANAAIVDISSDNKLTKGEKPGEYTRWKAVQDEYPGIDAQAAAFSIGNLRTNYRTYYTALETYINGLGAEFSTFPGSDIAIVGTTYRGKFSDYYYHRQQLLNEIANEASKKANWASVAGRPADSEIKNNLIDLSLWRRGTRPSWPINHEGNAIFSVSPSGTVDFPGPTWPGIPGPRGGNDLVWYCQEQGLVDESGSRGPGGGWDANGTLQLDTTRTYRFVIPIRRLTKTGHTYWGPQSNSVCSLNDTQPHGNPYFADTNGFGSLLTDRWYLFVGYIFPANSQGNTHDSAGIWDCKTGQKVKNGQNYCFFAGSSGLTGHRAYQYYAELYAEQIFGRPMVNLVDGSEPSLREYFEAGAMMNTAISMSANGTLLGAGGGKVTLPGMGINHYRVVSQGAQAGAKVPTTPGFWVNGVHTIGVIRGYTLVAIRRSDLAIYFQQTYDTYDPGAGNVTSGRTGSHLAADLWWFAGQAGKYILVIYTHDEPSMNRSADLLNAMYKNGASRGVYGSPNFKVGCAYVLIGLSGCGEGNGAESYQGAVNGDPDAWVDVTFSTMNGELSSVSQAQTPKTLQDYGFLGDMNANFSSPSRGAALNDDPQLENAAAWAMDGGLSIVDGTQSPGAAGSKYITAYTYAAATNSKAHTRRFAIDPNKVYHLSANLYMGPGNNREMYVFINFYDVSGNWISTSWGAAMSGYVYGGVQAGDQWVRRGALIGVGTSRPIPANARTANIGVWFQYSGSGSSSVQQAAQDIRIVEAATSLQAANGTFADLRIEDGGAISNGAYSAASGYAWPAANAGGGFLLNKSGFLAGNANDPNRSYILMNFDTGRLAMPGFDYSGRQLTLEQPVLVNPKTSTSFNASMSSLILTNQVNTNTYQTYSKAPALANGTGPYTYTWTFTVEEGDIRMTSSPSDSSATIQARGWNQVRSGWLTVTVKDANGATASASCRISIQYGSGTPQ